MIAAIKAMTMPYAGEEIPEYVIFDEIGDYGNIAMIGSNGLTGANNNVSSELSVSYDGDACFDGYGDSVQLYAGVGARIPNGDWRTVSGQNTDQWISVNLGAVAAITGFRALFPGWVRSGGLGMKNVMVQGSVDGIAWEDHELVQFALVSSSTITLSQVLYTQYVRLFIQDVWGGAYVSMNELEIYQTGV
jgi:hypothetical protein